MNIIKFKDILVEGKDWYNEHLRGKYAYWLHCQYAVPFESIVTKEDYASYERDIESFLESGIEYVDTENESWVIIDSTLTTKEYDPSYYVAYNKYIPDDDVTLSDVKDFRTWLASSLLEAKAELSDNDKHMLEYYVGNMNDETIGWLNVFGNASAFVYDTNTTTTNGCGCGNSNLSSLYNTTVTACDPISIYKNNLKVSMVKLFSNIDTWLFDVTKGTPLPFLDDLVKYLEAILIYNLPLYADQSIIDVYSCKCLSNGNAAQGVGQQIIRNLIEAFTFINKGDIEGNKNFITRALSEWSANLYEIMYWDSESDDPQSKRISLKNS